MHRNRNYRDLEKDKNLLRRDSEQLDFADIKAKESDEDEFETYAYEYKKESYLRNPKAEEAQRKKTSSKHFTTDRPEKKSSRHRSPEASSSQQYRHNKSSYMEYSPEKNEKRQETSHNYSHDQGKESSYTEAYAGRKHSVSLPFFIYKFNITH